MWWSERRQARLGAALALGLGLSACGFTPLYDSGTAASAVRGNVDFEVVSGAAGFVLREQLVNRLGVADDPDYRLEVDLALETSGIALTTGNLTTRFEVLGTAVFVLVPMVGGPPVLEGEVQALASYSAPETQSVSAFGSRAAERNAELRVARTLADRIVARIVLNADLLAGGSPPGESVDMR